MDKIIIKIKKRLWVYISLIFIIPIILNFILLIPAFLPIVGNQTDWLRFWATYLGIIIAIIIPSAVCYFSLRENRRARREQIKIEELKLFKESCVRCICNYNINIFSKTIANCINLEDIERYMKDHAIQTLNVHLDFLLNCLNSTENVKNLLHLENLNYNWHNNLLNDVYAYIKGLKYIKDKTAYKEYILEHNFHKTTPNINDIIEKYFNKPQVVFISIILRDLIRLYINENKEKHFYNDFITCAHESLNIENIIIGIKEYVTEQNK